MGRDLSTNFTDPYVDNSFGIELQYQSDTVAMFTSISGGSIEISVIEYTLNMKGGSQGIIIPGATAYEPVTLSFGITDDMTFWNWWLDVAGGSRNRIHVSIFAYGRLDSSTNEKKMAQWDLEYAWPQKISGFKFDLDSNKAFIGEVTLVVENIVRVDPTGTISATTGYTLPS